MRVEVRYVAQVRHAAGRAAEEVELEGPCAPRELVVRLAQSREELRGLLLDEGGAVKPALLLFVGDVQVDPGDPRPLREGEVVTILSPMAGG
jgi:molybdopterin converting factor small subunit